jgi:hypothetical protein
MVPIHNVCAKLATRLQSFFAKRFSIESVFARRRKNSHAIKWHWNLLYQQLHLEDRDHDL